jgi:hypothetical protein
VNKAKVKRRAQTNPPELLREMRRILRQDPDKDTAQDAAMRKFLDDDPRGYMKQLGDLEKAHQVVTLGLRVKNADRAAKMAVASPEGSQHQQTAPQHDDGAARAVRLLEDELAELKRRAEADDEAEA